MRFFPVRGHRRPTDDSSDTWVKSSFSAYTGNCVEVTGLSGDIIRVRNSKDADSEALSFTAAEWDAFLAGVRNGEFDREAREPGAG
jgi:hypothetical protein